MVLLGHRYVLKNLTRDWSAEGSPERAQSYGRIMAAAERCLGRPQPGQPPPRVLVPGAGLGRLCVDLASLGYEAQVRVPEKKGELLMFVLFFRKIGSVKFLPRLALLQSSSWP